MSTRLRPIVMLNGDVVTGGHVRTWLEAMASSLKLEVPPRGSMPEGERLVKLYKCLPLSGLGRTALWLFREPRNIPSNRSRYMQLAQYYGIGPRNKKKDLAFSLQLDRIVNRQRQRAAERERERIVSQTAMEMARMQQGMSQPPIDWSQQVATSPTNQAVYSGLVGQLGAGVTTSRATSLGFDWAPTYTWDPPQFEREEP